MITTRWQNLVALAAYLAISVAYFGLPVFGDFSHLYIGHRWDSDPSAFMWFLGWWPYAIRHGLNPFLTRVVWAPTGFNLAWAASVPGASLLAAPLTLTHGVVVAYNVWALAAPALAAWTAYLLCRHPTNAFWASLIGGYVFGFSTYELKQLSNHMNLFLIFLTPLAVYLVLLRLEGRMRSAAFVPLLAAVLALQFSFSTEVMLTTTLAGAAAMVLAFVIGPPEFRDRLSATVLPVAGAYVLAGLLAAPHLYHAFALGFSQPPRYLHGEYSADALSFVIPTDLTVGHRYVSAVARTFAGRGEQQAYFGLPLIGLLLLCAREQWGRPAARLLCLLLALICVISLGPILHVAGRPIVPLPWMLLLHVPLLGWIIPSRVIMYGFLIAALGVAVWLRDTAPPRWATVMLLSLPLVSLRALGPGALAGAGARAALYALAALGVGALGAGVVGWPRAGATRPPVGARWALALLSVLFLLPDLSSGYWKERVDTPAFFATGMYRTHLSPGENTLIIPYGLNGNSMLWQAQSGMYFRMAGGYVRDVIPPPEFSRWPIVETFYSGVLVPNYDRELRAFLQAQGVRTIIVARPNPPGRWADSLLSTLGVPPVRAGGVILSKVR